MLLTLNQVISQITTLAAAHSQIAASGVGDFAEWQAEERNYPLLWVFHETTNVGNRELVYSIRLICADRVITGEEGEDTDGMEQEVLSDTLLILLDFLAYFQQQHSQTYTVVPSATIDPFTERFNDRVAGNSMVIQIRQPFTWDACQIPQTGATIPPTVDGLTLYDFCDQSVIDRLTADQVTCLQAELCTPCSPVTQQVNGTTIGTTVSGGTNNQLIRNTAGTAVGTSANPSVIANTTLRNSAAPTWTDVVVAGVTKTLAQGKALDSDGATTLLANYIPTTDGFMFTCTPAADATVTINGASLGATGDIPSGGSEDLDVLQGGSPVGSWNGSAWIIPTCPAVPSLSIALSDTTPNFGDAVTITVTPTGITPTSYTFGLPNKYGDLVNVTQASNVYVWTANNIGADSVVVTATDGASIAANSSSVTTTISLSTTNGKSCKSPWKLVSSYAGSCVKVRRLVDNASADFGFLNGYIDIAAIRTWAGNNGFLIVDFYDQFSNGNLNQSTANIQPAFTGSDFMMMVATSARMSLTMTSGFALGETSTDYLIHNPTRYINTNSRIIRGGSDVRNISAITPNSIVLYDGVNVITTGGLNLNKKHVLAVQAKTNACAIYVDGVSQALTGTTYAPKAVSTFQFYNDGSGALKVEDVLFNTHVSYAADYDAGLNAILQLLCS